MIKDNTNTVRTLQTATARGPPLCCCSRVKPVWGHDSGIALGRHWVCAWSWRITASCAGSRDGAVFSVSSVLMFLKLVFVLQRGSAGSSPSPSSACCLCSASSSSRSWTKFSSSSSSASWWRWPWARWAATPSCTSSPTWVPAECDHLTYRKSYNTWRSCSQVKVINDFSCWTQRRASQQTEAA